MAALVLRDGSNDLNMRSALLHMAGDALASLAVVVAAVILLFVPSATWLDPVSALAVAAIIVVQAVRVFRSSIAVLLESTPSDLDLAQLTATMAGVPGVGEVHDLHVWSLSSEMRVLSAHMVLTGHPTLEEAQVGRRPGEGDHRRPVRDLPHHAGTGVRAVQRRGRSLPDGGRLARGHLGPPALSGQRPPSGPDPTGRPVPGRDAAPSNRAAETAQAPRGHALGGLGLTRAGPCRTTLQRAPDRRAPGRAPRSVTGPPSR